MYAPDPEAYDVFADLFYPVIGEYHKVDVKSLKSVHDLGDASKLEDLSDKYSEQIVSTRVRVGRTVKGFPMASKLSREVNAANATNFYYKKLNRFIIFFKQRLELESRVKEALGKLDGDLAGTYKSLTEMSYDERNKLIDEHILYNDAEDKYLRSAGGYNDWPIGRGIFMNKAKNFIVWVNEEDHIRIISMQKGASLKQVWGRLVKVR